MPPTTMRTNESAPPVRVVEPAAFSCAVHAVAPGAVRLAAAGELDIATVAEFDHALRRAQAEAELVIVDLGALEFMDSSGVHLLRTAESRIRRAGGRLVVVRAPAHVVRLFGAAGIDRELKLVG